MKICITCSIKLPVYLYGGAERVIWDLCHLLSTLGHEVFLLAPKGSICSFAEVIESDLKNIKDEKIPPDVDIVHFFSSVPENYDKPFIYTLEGNAQFGEVLPQQTVFVSRNQAMRHGGDCFVYNSLTPREGNLSLTRGSFHFLGKAAWKRKNVRGAILCAKKANRAQIDILGGTRLNFNMGFRFSTDLHARFHGMVDDDFKKHKITKSRGLVFPVLWNDPCPLSIIESLYWGSPVFGTPYGSLPELVPDEVGFLSANSDDLAEAMKDSGQWKPKVCRDYAIENFNSKKMALKYLEIYERVIDGEVLNESIPTLQEPEPKLLPFR
jgi:glycosyltransferase involved in cell wall biosynthesis